MDEIKLKVDGLGRKLYSVEERERLMGECEASGKTQREFALERGLNPSTLSYWFRNFIKKRPSVKLKPIDTKPLFSASTTKSDAAIEIICGSIIVRLYRDR